jgi:serine/threonine protein kinase
VEYKESIREIRVLAQGGCGIVVLADALDQKLKQYGDKVIVKRLKTTVSSEISNEREVQLFNQEVSLMQYFQGEKHIAKLLGYSTEPYCLVMKYYELGSLKQFMKTRKHRSKINILAFGHDISCGLKVMHDKGVVHNDLKPDNVLLDLQGNKPFCVLTDLGISQVVTRQILKVRQFQIVQVKGLSIAYASPERLAAFRKMIDLNVDDPQTVFSVDVYSLGVLLFELMTANNQPYK